MRFGVRPGPGEWSASRRSGGAGPPVPRLRNAQLAGSRVRVGFGRRPLTPGPEMLVACGVAKDTWLGGHRTSRGCAVTRHPAPATARHQARSERPRLCSRSSGGRLEQGLQLEGHGHFGASGQTSPPCPGELVPPWPRPLLLSLEGAEVRTSHRGHLATPSERDTVLPRAPSASCVPTRSCCPPVDKWRPTWP